MEEEGQPPLSTLVVPRGLRHRRGSNVSASAAHLRVESIGAETEGSSQDADEADEKYQTNIRVVVRKRPKSVAEKGDSDVVQVSGDTVVVFEPKVRVDMTKVVEPSIFAFDTAFGDDASNEDVYSSCVRPLVESVQRGHNAITFAFGQTGSGKTHTMFGSPTADVPGLFALASRELFSILKGMRLYVSFYEIYGAKLYDLLNDRATVQTREDEGKVLRLVGLTEHDVRDFEALMELMQIGTSQRAAGSTHANDWSSRSHAIMALTTKSRRDLQSFGTMTFVDLAGSERAADTNDLDKKTRREGAEINKSLLALKECIRALDLRKRHVPFRGSKLTQVLRDCFVSGESTTLVIANVSPCQRHCEDTLNTLRYAHRIKELKREGAEGLSPLAVGVPCDVCGGPIHAGKDHQCLQRKQQCPHCRKPIRSASWEAHQETCGDRLITCAHCGVRCAGESLKKHQKRCGKVPVPCEQCGALLTRDAMPQHSATSCPSAVVSCPHCRTATQRAALQNHIDCCPACPVNCSQCGAVVRRGKIDDHALRCPSKRLRRSSSLYPTAPLRPKPDASPLSGRARRLDDCTSDEATPLRPGAAFDPSPQQEGAKLVACPFAARGCVRRMPRSKVQSHLRNGMAYHLGLLQTQLAVVEEENRSLRHALAKAAHESAIPSDPQLAIKIDTIAPSDEDDSDTSVRELDVGL